ncbi:hypothetical protein AAMO2058_001346900 [Amorphochlora amoebiformis]
MSSSRSDEVLITIRRIRINRNFQPMQTFQNLCYQVFVHYVVTATNTLAPDNTNVDGIVKYVHNFSYHQSAGASPRAFSLQRLLQLRRQVGLNALAKPHGRRRPPRRSRKISKPRCAFPGLSSDPGRQRGIVKMRLSREFEELGEALSFVLWLCRCSMSSTRVSFVD